MFKNYFPSTDGTQEFHQNYSHWQQVIESEQVKQQNKSRKISNMPTLLWEGVTAKPLYSSIDKTGLPVEMDSVDSLVSLKISAQQLGASVGDFFGQELMTGTDCVTIELKKSADLSLLSILPPRTNIILRFTTESLFKEFLALKIKSFPIEFDLCSFFIESKESLLGLFIEELSNHCQEYDITVLINTQFLQNIGANPVQELIFSYSMAQQLLLKKNQNLKVNILIPLSSDLFIELARLKALRQILHSKGVTGVDVQVYPSACYLTKRNVSMNILRGVMAALVGLIGGARKIFITPYDILLNGSDAEFSLDSYRLARNTVLILKEESRLGQVQDPSKGSWYVENLLNQFISEVNSVVDDGAMSCLNEIVLYVKTMSEKFYDQQVERLKQYRKRQKLIIGINDYVYFEDSIKLDSASCSDLDYQNHFRWSQAFEDLQDQVDIYISKGGSRPCVYVINVGPTVNYLPRMNFVQNFFEVGGFCLFINEDGFDSVETGLKAFAESDISLAIICSTDEVYQSLSPNLKVNHKKVLLAGNPGDKKVLWEEAGIYDFIYLGCDCVQKLSNYLSIVGLNITGVKE